MKIFQGRPVRQTQYQGRQVSYVDDQLIVKLKPEFRESQQARESVLNALPQNSVLQNDFDRTGMAVFVLPESFDPLEVAKNLSEQECVQFAEPNFLESAS